MIANLNSLYVERPLPEKTIEETRLKWGSELIRTLEGVSGLDAQVIIAQPPPRFAYDLRYDLSLLWPNSVIETRAEVVNRREVINSIEQNALAGFAFVQPVVNFTDTFCTASICDPKVNNEFMLEDGDHLSVDGSLLVKSVLEESIKLALAK